VPDEDKKKDEEEEINAGAGLREGLEEKHARHI
jgi:hypothetical protein